MQVKLLPTLFCLLLQSASSLGLLVPTTIDDTDPEIRYNLYDPAATPVRCSAKGCSPSTDGVPDTNYSQMVNGTMTSMAGKITIMFTGTTLALYFATLHTFTAAIHIDTHYVATVQQRATQPAVGNVLGYTNTSIPDGSHFVVIISEQGTVIDFDALIYSPPPTHPSPLPPTQPLSHTPSPTSAPSPSPSRSSHSNAPTINEQSSSTASGTSRTGATALPTAAPTAPSERAQSALISRTFPTAAIGGIVAGGVSLIAFLCLAAIALRRRARRWKTCGIDQPFLVDDPEPRAQQPGTASPATTNPAPSYLTEHLFKLEARFDALASIVRRPSESSERSPPAYRDAA
ncbi:hypothetical protein DFH09DRAFT_1277063 [Mycena vulgaris]|nr:hypothetical protein DFH09DRAFT_1277063 [Mycena vulgaris]